MKINKWQAIGIGLAIVTGLLAWFPYRHGHPEPIGMIFFSPFVSLFVLSLWLSIGGNVPNQRKMILWSLVIGIVIGWAAFVAGYFGPIIFMPNANQGPLFGIFFTGPLGFAGGIILGIPISFIINARKRKKETQQAGSDYRATRSV